MTNLSWFSRGLAQVKHWKSHILGKLAQLVRLPGGGNFTWDSKESFIHASVHAFIHPLNIAHHGPGSFRHW